MKQYEVHKEDKEEEEEYTSSLPSDQMTYKHPQCCPMHLYEF